MSKEEYQQEYEDFWKPIICHDDGTLNEDQIARELYDYRILMANASFVYENIAGVTKPNTDPHYIISEHERLCMEAADDAEKEASAERDRYKEEAERLRKGWLSCLCDLTRSGSDCDYRTCMHSRDRGDYCQAVLDAVDKGAQ